MSQDHQDPDELTPAPAETVAEAEAQVDQTRAELADTVEALAAKADVKGRLQDAAPSSPQEAVGVAERNPAVVGGVAGALVLLVLLRRRRRRRRAA